MDCQLFERQAQRGLDGLLTRLEQDDVLKHAASCGDCAALLQDMVALDSLLATQLSVVDAPPGFAAGVMAALPNPYQKQGKLLHFPRRTWLRWGSAAAAALLLVSSAVYGLLPSGNAPSQQVEPVAPAVVAQQPQQPQNQLEQPLVNQPPSSGQLQQAQLELDEEGGFEKGLAGLALNEGENIEQENIAEVAAPKELPPDPETEAQPQPYSVNVDLPHPATYSAQTGEVLSLNVLAAYDDCDALLPSLNEDGLVEFYIKYKGLTHQWTQTLAADADPEYQGQVKQLPSLSQIMGSIDESEVAGYPHISAISPNGRTVAVNRGGDYHGIWLYDDEAEMKEAEMKEAGPEQGLEISNGFGGGTVLSWSPDGNKLLYTDATGKLFVYYLYIATPYSLPLFPEGIVTCASWAEDSRTVLFAGKEEKSGRSSIYTIMIP